MKGAQSQGSAVRAAGADSHLCDLGYIQNDMNGGEHDGGLTKRDTAVCRPPPSQAPRRVTRVI